MEKGSPSLLLLVKIQSTNKRIKIIHKCSDKNKKQALIEKMNSETVKTKQQQKNKK